MKELSNLWQSFALTGDPRQYLKFKKQENELSTVQHLRSKFAPNLMNPPTQEA